MSEPNLHPIRSKARTQNFPSEQGSEPTEPNLLFQSEIGLVGIWGVVCVVSVLGVYGEFASFASIASETLPPGSL